MQSCTQEQRRWLDISQMSGSGGKYVHKEHKCNKYSFIHWRAGFCYVYVVANVQIQLMYTLAS